MRTMKRLAGAALAAVSIAVAGDAGAATPLEAYRPRPNVTNMTISPDGSRIAAVVDGAAGRTLVIRDAATGKPIQALGLPDLVVQSLTWLGSDQIVMTTAKTGKSVIWFDDHVKFLVPSLLDLKSGRVTRLLQNEPQALDVIWSTPMVARDAKGRPRLIMEGDSLPDGYDRKTVFGFSGLDSARIATGDEYTRDFAVSPTGEVVGKINFVHKTGEWRILTGHGAFALKPVLNGVDPVQPPFFEGVSADGKSVFVGQYPNDQFVRRQIDLDTGQVTPLDGELGRGDAILDHGTHAVIGVYESGLEGGTYHFLDPADVSLWSAVQKGFAGAIVSWVDASTDRKRLLVEVDGGGFGDSYYLIDRATGQAKWLGDLRTGVGPKEISSVRTIKYKAADGLSIDAYLTLPNGRDPKGLPLIVMPHGGPFARDYPGFDWWPQALASRGYAVLQPQFRGSDDLGAELLHAGFGELGRKMQTDLSDGVAELARQGLADPRRVAIVGASYGGYAALAGVTLQAGVYRCAVSIAGLSDVKAWLKDLRSFNDGDSRTPSSRYWKQFLGVKSDDDPALDDISPELHASNASAPVLLIHGDEDTRVPMEHSLRMQAALNKAGKPVELVVLKGEDHNLQHTGTSAEMLNAQVKFLETCNPPG